ncbi:MAG: chromosomal replication initiator protein DnaA [Bacillales bacterium]|nr:chromosomal replication initiator protein DnaA [Bacillales bacterium]
MAIVKEKWQEIINNLRIEHDITDVSFNTWVKPLYVYDVIDKIILIKVEAHDHIDYISNKYLLPLKVCIAETIGEEYDIIFFSDEDKIQHLLDSSLNLKKSKSVFEKAGLNDKYTFDTFVVGGNNQFAHATAQAVASNPGKVYNPLFIYAEVGLGKTHLMHSIAHHILEENEKAKVIYVTSETFTNDLIHALRTNKGDETVMTNFRSKYRNSDILLIDDIQFLIGKESTQEEFFHTFNHLHTLGKQVVISSDKPPKEIETLEARLRTRFEMGIIADISAPDYETRMAILQNKIKVDGLEKYNIPIDVLAHIATYIKTNIRELEGSLNKLIALYKLNNQLVPLDINLANKVLADFISEDKREITPEYIIEVVAEHFSLSIKDLTGSSRANNVTGPRFMCMYLINKLTNTTQKGIGAVLGKRDHSTVKNGLDKIELAISNDEAVANTIEILTKKINPVLSI